MEITNKKIVFSKSLTIYSYEGRKTWEVALIPDLTVSVSEDNFQIIFRWIIFQLLFMKIKRNSKKVL